MRETGERGRRFVDMMFIVLCVVAGLLALVGVTQYLSVFDFHGVGGMPALGLYFGFRVVAVLRLSEPTIPRPTRERP